MSHPSPSIAFSFNLFNVCRSVLIQYFYFCCSYIFLLFFCDESCKEFINLILFSKKQLMDLVILSVVVFIDFCSAIIISFLLLTLGFLKWKLNSFNFKAFPFLTQALYFSTKKQSTKVPLLLYLQFSNFYMLNFNYSVRKSF